MANISLQYYKTPIGELVLGSFEGKLCLCDWRYRRMRTGIDKRVQLGLKATYVEQPCDVLDETALQLADYFDKKRQQFELPLLMVGTSFQQRVWQALLQIPYGNTIAYNDLAKQLGNTKAVRAVANANRANAMSLVIPCHRVVGSSGELTGYAGGLPAKKRLLALEQDLIDKHC
jgi:methylated-DNA-[protein]-cysteine S-methyltransferase